MHFARVSGQRQEAQPDLSGECLFCDSPMLAKCGPVRVWHWAHKVHQRCDPWWEPETKWHRDWKDQFLHEWQEVVQLADDGERHIADVKTGDGWVLEFQHSPIKPDERRSREAFYRKLVWVVDGTRRKRDRAQLVRAWEDGVRFRASPLVRKAYSDDCALLREWAGSSAPIFFDLGEPERLWWLFGKSTTGWVYLHPFSRAQFIEWHRSTATEAARQFDEFVTDILRKWIADYESHSLTQPLSRDPLQPRGFRRRFRF